jgi:hypothetical protein
LSDVQDCYTQQNSQITTWTSSATIDNIYKVLTGTCYNTALTCGYAVFAYDKEMGNAISDTSLPESDKQLKLIDGISQMFYQTMLCPENSEYVSESTAGMINDRCACKAGYMVSEGQCIASCPTDKPKKLFGICAAGCLTGMVEKNNECLLSASVEPSMVYRWENNDWQVGCLDLEEAPSSLCNKEFPVVLRFENYGDVYGKTKTEYKTRQEWRYSGGNNGQHSAELVTVNYYNCYAKMVKYRSKNGATYSFDTEWVYIGELSSADECSEAAAGKLFQNDETRMNSFGKYGTWDSLP